jgi:hypothetical protein
MVTHDQRAASAARRLVHLDKGVLTNGEGWPAKDERSAKGG